jgi:hypothetical protein
MVIITNVAHKDTDLAVINFSSVPTSLALHPHGMRAALGETARIEGDDAIGMSQSMRHLRHQHLDQRPMIPRGGTDEFLHDEPLDIDESGDVLGIFAR